MTVHPHALFGVDDYGWREPALARVSDPDTSHVAARSVTPGRTEAAILFVFARWPAMTDDGLCDRLIGHYPPTVKSARSRLTRAGLLVDSGERRMSERNRPMIVWTKASE